MAKDKTLFKLEIRIPLSIPVSGKSDGNWNRIDLESAINDYRVMNQIVAAVEQVALPEVKPAQKYDKIEIGPAKVDLVGLVATAGK